MSVIPKSRHTFSPDELHRSCDSGKKTNNIIGFNGEVRKEGTTSRVVNPTEFDKGTTELQADLDIALSAHHAYAEAWAPRVTGILNQVVSNCKSGAPRSLSKSLGIVLEYHTAEACVCVFFQQV